MRDRISPSSEAGLISVITAVKNGARTLAQCMQSVSTQANVAVEHIVIDGGSTDGTLEILEQHSSTLSCWVSEADQSLYAALNKGLRKSRGAWICFLGADDAFSDHLALRRLLDCAIRERTQIVTSQVRLVDASTGQILRIIGEPWNWTELLAYQRVAHPGLLHSRQVFVRHGLFDESLQIVGDYEFLLRLGKEIPTAHVDAVSVSMGSAGLSNIRVLDTLKERFEVQKRHPSIGRLRASCHFAMALAKAMVKGRI